MAETVQKETYNVSSAHPDKIVVNGVDLVNREQLSNSQNRELQRFINNHSHLLGFYDKPKDQTDGSESGIVGGNFRLSSSGSMGPLRRGPSDPFSGESIDKNSTLNRLGSPSSEYGKNRKGVSFADGVDTQRARSHSPTNDNLYGSGYGQPSYGYGEPQRAANGRADPYGQSNAYPQHSTTMPSYSANKRAADPSAALRSRTESPAPFKWNPYQSYEPPEKERGVHPEYPTWLKDRSLTPAYSALERHPDNYNRYGTQKFHSRETRSIEKDDEIKFPWFGDRIGSGIELTRKPWTGGEIVTDPDYFKKYRVKPRRMYYSPIGDGCVAADGIEKKKGPVDLSPKVYVSHERVVEKGDAGAAGRRVYEHTWDTGAPGGDDGNRGNDGGWPNNLGDGGDGRGKGDPFGDRGNDGGPNAGWPNDDDSRRGDPYGTLGSNDGYPRSDRFSPLSVGSGVPREGWTREFITNPRELINQYGMETLTTIFDLEDHTPKTMITTKETISAADAESTAD